MAPEISPSVGVGFMTNSVGHNEVEIILVHIIFLFFHRPFGLGGVWYVSLPLV